MFKVRIVNAELPELDSEGCYNGVDWLCLNEDGLLVMVNNYTENKVATPIRKDEMILIFWED